MKSLTKTIFSILFLFMALYYAYNLVNFKQYQNVSYITESSEKCTLYGTEKCYISRDHIYTININSGIVHIFDTRGCFLKSIYIPGNGGIFWSGMSDDRIHVYSVRNNLQVNLVGDRYETIENKEYINLDDFIEQNDINVRNLYKLNKNKVVVKDIDNSSEIALESNIKVLSMDLCVLLFSIFILAFVITSGLSEIIK